MDVLDSLLQGIVEDPSAEDVWLVLADWLEEHDDPRRAELLRLHRRLLATCCAPAEHSEREAWQARVVDLLAQGVQPCLPQRTVKLGEGVALTFSFIPPGTFLMGSPPEEPEREEEETLHRVTLTRGFWLATTPLTQAQWAAGVGGNPSDGLPVTRVSWDDCVGFCGRLGETTGRRFRLPTEAEWEYACRAGTTTPYFVGWTLGKHQAAFGRTITRRQGGEGIDLGQPAPVGSYPPNAWGLHDMHGGVWEWTPDGMDDYPEGDAVDPLHEVSGARGLRGGSWLSNPGLCRSACRSGDEPGLRDDEIGCRVALDPGGPD